MSTLRFVLQMAVIALMLCAAIAYADWYDVKPACQSTDTTGLDNTPTVLHDSVLVVYTADSRGGTRCGCP
ncbi:MAG: hypothetical protein IPK53_02780 [bacterium]|nr:hypothetical protein [bacterium]